MQPIKGALPRATQLRILAVCACVLAGILVAVPALRSLAARPAPVLPKMLKSSFDPSSDQWANITLGTVTHRKFPGLVSVDATVATDDDLATQVFSPFTGQIRDIVVHAGDRVEKGAVLMTVAATEAVQSESDLVAAADAWNAARVAAHNADEGEKRQHALYQDGSVALKDWQQSQADQATAQAALRTADASLIAARGKMQILGFREAQIHALETAPKGRAVFPLAQLLAPISGTVAQRLVGPGQFVQAGSASPVFAIGNFGKLWLVGNVREEDATQMRPGEAVDVTVAAVPGRSFPAKLTWVAPSIDAATHRLAVRAEIDNPDGKLKPAMFATMLVHTGSDRISAAIPEIAVIHEGDQSHVWATSGVGSLALRSIRTGRLQDGYVEVLNGLAAGERVALSGSLFLDSTAHAD
jgi:cobalt-zinc-cadmium efflux system membrane fusion protein